MFRRADSPAMGRFYVMLVTLLVRGVMIICRSRAELVLENLALRQQLTALKQRRPRPALDDADRGFWVPPALVLAGMAQSAAHRQTRHRGEVAPAALPTLLDEALAGQPRSRPTAYRR